MKVLVTGVAGQLGHDVVKKLQLYNIDCLGTDKSDFDITDAEATTKFIECYSPDVVVHCAAYTDVDKAEDEPEICKLVNANGTENIAKVCKYIGAKLMYISTDYVFDGTKKGFYLTDDKVCPINVYGVTKEIGEQVVSKFVDKHFIVRISWVFGTNGNNFVKTMLRLGAEHRELNIVADQVGSPTYTADLAELLVDMLQTEHYGTYHATNQGECSWAEFAEEIFKQVGMDVKVNHITAAEYPSKAKRPYNSRLCKRKLIENGFNYLPVWQNALVRYLAEIE